MIQQFKHMISLLVLGLLVMLNSSAYAGWVESAEGVLKSAKEVTGDVVDATKDAGGKALEYSKEIGEQAIDVSKKSLQTTQETLQGLQDTSDKPYSPEQRFQDTWEEVLEKLDEGLTLFDEIQDAPDSSLFGADKQSLRGDFNEILDDIIILLDDPQIKAYREKIDTITQQIAQVNTEIASYREKRVTAPREHVVKTTKKGYDQQIKEAGQEIVQYEGEIDQIHLFLIDRFRAIGLDIDINQLTVLLSRVDSENIIQMSVVFDVLKKITKQLMVLTQSSGEAIKTAKRYYGMHVILIEMVVYMQSKYIEIINSQYLPKIGTISNKTVALVRETKVNIARETESSRIAIYKKNLQSQSLTIKVARLYLNNLTSQREKVVEAKKKAMADFRLAFNTYETVEVSADLVNLLNASQGVFQAVINLQVPEIVPFENYEMQQKYQDLSRMMIDK